MPNISTFIGRVFLTLIVFPIVAAVIFYNKLSDQLQMIMFMKNFAIAGGLLMLVEHGAGFYGLDRHLKKSLMSMHGHGAVTTAPSFGFWMA